MGRPHTLSATLPIWHRLVRRLGPAIHDERRLVGLTILALLAETGLRVLEPWPLKFVFDAVLASRHAHVPAWLTALGPDAMVFVAAAAVLVITGLRAGAAYAGTVAGALAGTRVVSRLRDELYAHVQRLPLTYHARARAGDLTVRLVGDIGVMKDVAITALLPLVTNVLILLGMAVVMVWFTWQLGLVAVGALPLVALATARLGRRIHSTAREQRRHEGDLAAKAAESIVGVRVVRALSLEHEFGRSFKARNSGSLAEGVRGKRLEARLERTADLMVAAVTALVLWVGAHLVLRGRLTPGDLLVFLAYLKTGFRPVNDFAKYSGRIAKAAAAADRVLDVLDESAGDDRPGCVEAPAFVGHVQVDRVCFAYEPGRQALRDVTLDVPAGSRVFVMGPSGSGKTTLVSLLLRLYEPTTGTIRVDGHDLQSFTGGSVRRQCSVVLQDTLLFAGTLRENIACGLNGATDADLVDAARLADAHDFISRLPTGYDTPVGERGITLSAGQRQRIAIARAALRRTPFVILDEPTTGLDDLSKGQVMEALDRLGAGRTTFFVTHEVSLARHRADLVVWVDHGRILEAGRPEALMASGGSYARAVEAAARLMTEDRPRAVAG